MNKKMTLLTTLCCLLLLYSCSKDGSSNNNTNNPGTLDCSTVTNKAFAADVNPIIQGTCASQVACHGSGSVNGPGALTSYSAIFNSRSNIRSAVASGTMPKTGTLSTAQKNSILCWIDSGAPNN
ncbi:MAG: hypothetical protein HZA79_00750 [Sphingobacteriales bacterium]|nr:hypothetical protein [Sphingobacteriales bacterium]